MSAKAWIISAADGTLYPGYYRVRLVKDGPWVPVCLEESVEVDELTGEAMGDAVYTLTVDGRVILNFETKYRQWGLFGQKIDQAEYAYMRATTRHASRYDVAHHPAANPDKPVDLMTCPLPF